MKVLKNATQKNIILNKIYYTELEIKEMLENREIFFFSAFSQCYDYLEYYNNDEENINLRIFTEDITDIKVVYNNFFGNYETVATGKNGKTYHVEL